MCISKHYKSLLKFHTNSKSIIETNKKGGVGNYLLPHFSWVFCALFVYYFTKWFLNWQWYIIFWNGYWNSMQNESMPPLYNKLQFTHLSLLAMFSHQYLQTRFLLILFLSFKYLQYDIMFLYTPQWPIHLMKLVVIIN